MLPWFVVNTVAGILGLNLVINIYFDFMIKPQNVKFKIQKEC